MNPFEINKLGIWFTVVLKRGEVGGRGSGSAERARDQRKPTVGPAKGKKKKKNANLETKGHGDNHRHQQLKPERESKERGGERGWGSKKLPDNGEGWKQHGHAGRMPG